LIDLFIYLNFVRILLGLELFYSNNLFAAKFSNIKKK